jgi:urease beta subunit
MGYSLTHVDDIEGAGPGGSVRFVRRVLGGEEVPVAAGTFLRFDPGTTRVPIAGPEGLTMIAVGARRGSYEPRGPF